MSTLEKELEKSFQESIKNNLPHQVGETLKQRLKEAEEDAKEVKRLSAKLDKAEKLAIVALDNFDKEFDKYELEIKQLKREINCYMSNDKRNSELDYRQKSLEKAEQTLRIEQLTYELNVEKEKTEFTKSVALGLVRNLEYRKNTFDNETQAGYNGANGNWIHPTPINKNSSITDTIT